LISLQEKVQVSEDAFVAESISYIEENACCEDTSIDSPIISEPGKEKKGTFVDF